MACQQTIEMAPKALIVELCTGFRAHILGVAHSIGT